MANRTALRELQTRLASRLQAARTEDKAVSWLAIESGGGRYLFPLAQAEQIFPFTPTEPVPYAQPWFKGVANLRGGLYSVIDFSHFVANKAPARASTDGLPDSSMVTLNPVLEVNCALLIDRLSGLRGVDAFRSSDEAPAGSPDYFGHLYSDANGVSWQEINLQLLSKLPRFLGIGI